MPFVCGGFFMVKRYRFQQVFFQKVTVKNLILPSSPVLMRQKNNSCMNSAKRGQGLGSS